MQEINRACPVCGRLFEMSHVPDLAAVPHHDAVGSHPRETCSGAGRTGIPVHNNDALDAPSPENTEADRWTSARAGDEMFADVYRDNCTRVLAFIMSRIRDDELAQELTSEVFYRAYNRWAQLQNQAAATWWLFSIARTTIAGHFRKRSREMKTQEKLQVLAGNATEDCPSVYVERSLDVERLRHFIAQLSGVDQELLSLRFDAALTTVEIANVLGLSQQNVRVRIFRALRRLRVLMVESDVGVMSAQAQGQPGR